MSEINVEIYNVDEFIQEMDKRILEKESEIDSLKNKITFAKKAKYAMDHLQASMNVLEGIDDIYHIPLDECSKFIKIFCQIYNMGSSIHGEWFTGLLWYDSAELHNCLDKLCASTENIPKYFKMFNNHPNTWGWLKIFDEKYPFLLVSDTKCDIIEIIVKKISILYNWCIYRMNSDYDVADISKKFRR